MDVAKLIIRIRCASMINDVFNIDVEEVKFKIKIMEEAQGPVTSFKSKVVKDVSDTSSMDSIPILSGGESMVGEGAEIVKYQK